MTTESRTSPVQEKLLILEPFYGGSHKQLLDTLRKEFAEWEYRLYTLPAKKWHWRARTSALYFSQVIPTNHEYRVLFSTSVLNLSDLIALRRDLYDLRKVIYFHENQLVYPRQNEKERDFQYGYNQLLTCLVADVILFNSKYNADSFLNNIDIFLRTQPDHRPKSLRAQIEPKCRVHYFPIDYTVLHPRLQYASPFGNSVHIAWTHRWEHDKNFGDFYEALKIIKEEGYHFFVSVFGERYGEVPEVFGRAQKELAEHIVHFGYVESKEEYYEALKSVDIVVSTAKHEFFGVAMLEAAYIGCLPLCPRSLVYPELYPDCCLYVPTVNGLVNMLKQLNDPKKVREMRENLDMAWEKYDESNVLPELRRILFSQPNDISSSTDEVVTASSQIKSISD